MLKGSFDQYAESTRGKHGTAEVDDAFLMEIERWRELLARNIALRNPALSQRELNYAVQMTIDRLIFLRICEDRGIEFYGQLQALLNGGEVYPRLTQLFRKADERYNSGLFHFRDEKEQADTPDRLTLGLALDDKPLKDILGSLYYPESPYEFSVLPADILGQVYERFLGKVIRLTSRAPRRGGRKARSEESRRGVLHADLHRRVYRQEYGGSAAGRQETRRAWGGRQGRSAAHPRPGLRQRLVPAGRLPVPCWTGTATATWRQGRRSGQAGAARRWCRSRAASGA